VRRYRPFLLAALLGAGLWFLLREGGVEAITGAPVEHEERPEAGPVELRGAPRAPEAEGSEGTVPGGGSRMTPPGAAEGEERAFLTGVVVEAETGAPIHGAMVWMADQQEACPAILDSRHLLSRPDGDHPTRRLATTIQRVPTDDAGRFRLLAREFVPTTGSVDLFASATGRVVGVVCAPTIPGEVTIRLWKGLELHAVVVDPSGRPVTGARVSLGPTDATPRELGHVSGGTTDERGEARLGGLRPGEVLAEVEHPQFMPGRFGPFDPARDREVAITLVPALRAVFEVRSDDGRPIENLTVRWTTDGPTPRSELLLIPTTPLATKGEPGSEVVSEAVRIPAGRGTVAFEVKADRYAAWISEREVLPGDEEERTYRVVLVGDQGVGTLKILLEDEAGRAMRFDESRSRVLAVERLDGPADTSGYVLEGGENLWFPSLPQGRYRIHLRSPAYAPLEVEAASVPGGASEVVARTRPPARVRVRFVSPVAVVVRFRVTQGGRVVRAWPMDAPATPVADPDEETTHAADAEGLLLSGLASGTHTIEVLNDDLEATPATVRLREGDTEEVEIPVRPR
jgi:protocatechuate 3,4-dioxygenase beta subunit